MLHTRLKDGKGKEWRTKCRRLTHQGTDVVLEDGLALEEDGAVGGTGTSVEQSASAPADHHFVLQDGFLHRVAATKRTDEQRGRTNKGDGPTKGTDEQRGRTNKGDGPTKGTHEQRGRTKKVGLSDGGILAWRFNPHESLHTRTCLCRSTKPGVAGWTTAETRRRRVRAARNLMLQHLSLSLSVEKVVRPRQVFGGRYP